jgi:negative regulator of sigma E activity
MTNANVQSVLRTREDASEEWLSALLDGELDDDEAGTVIGQLGKDARSRQAWTEYSLIGDAMRGCMADTSALEQRVKAALAAEPTVLAPVARPPTRQPVYWAVAAAAVVAITWTVLSVSPGNRGVQMAENSVSTMPQAAGIQTVADQEVASNDMAPYLAAHQDYAFMVAGEPEMHITPVSMNEDAQ